MAYITHWPSYTGVCASNDASITYILHSVKVSQASSRTLSPAHALIKFLSLKSVCELKAFSPVHWLNNAQLQPAKFSKQ